jgi:predicted XRE-type DNA-binding protein
MTAAASDQGDWEMASRAVKEKLPDHAFRSIGMPDAEVMLLKAELNRALKDAIVAAGWTQAKAGEAMGWAQPDVSQLMNDRFVRFSLDRLVQAALDLGLSISFGVGRPQSRAQASRVVLARWSDRPHPRTPAKASGVSP